MGACAIVYTGVVQVLSNVDRAPEPGNAGECRLSAFPGDALEDRHRVLEADYIRRCRGANHALVPVGWGTCLEDGQTIAVILWPDGEWETVAGSLGELVALVMEAVQRGQVSLN